MRRARVCGKICHRAKRDQCRCWCGGLFHGKQGEAAREAFTSSFGEDPKGERPQLARFRAAIELAQAAARGGTVTADVAQTAARWTPVQLTFGAFGAPNK